jgi:hypothetical protein
MSPHQPEEPPPVVVDVVPPVVVVPPAGDAAGDAFVVVVVVVVLLLLVAAGLAAGLVPALGAADWASANAGMNASAAVKTTLAAPLPKALIMVLLFLRNRLT